MMVWFWFGIVMNGELLTHFLMLCQGLCRCSVEYGFDFYLLIITKYDESQWKMTFLVSFENVTLDSSSLIVFTFNCLFDKQTSMV